MPRASFFVTVLSGIDRNYLPVQRAVQIFLADQLARLLACSSQAAQPREPTPHATVGHCGGSFSQGMLLTVVIHQGSLMMLNRFPIRFARPQELLRFVEQGLADELFET